MKTDSDIQVIERMQGMLKLLKADLKRLGKLSAMSYHDMSPRQCQKRDADANWIGMENIKRKYELHALAVEIGIAEMRESYEPISLTDGWHHFKHTPRKPFCK